MIIVIDGPAGSGKSSTAKAVAQKAGLIYLDSGALYRAVTLIYVRSGEDDLAFFEKLKASKLRFDFENNQFRIWLNNDEVTSLIRAHEVSSKVSVVAAKKDVRSFVNEYLHTVVEKGSFIADGRDLATVVFPDAQLKIYMIASIQARAERRFNELTEMGQSADLKEIENNLLERDQIDSGRKEAPLKKHEDAIELDTSNLTFDGQVEEIIKLIRSKGLLN